MGDGYPITRIETISDGKIDPTKMGYAGINSIDSYQDNVLESGDILMSHINSVKHLGKTALYEKENDETIIHGMNLLRLKPNRQILESKYARYYFDTLVFKRQIPRITKNSVNQSSFNVKALQELTIPLPPLDVQLKIADLLDRADSLIEKRKAQIDRLDLLVKSQFIEMFGDPVTNPKGWRKTNLVEVASKIGSGATPKGGKGSYKKSGVSLIRSMNVYNGKFEYSQLAFIDDIQAGQLKNVAVEENDILLNITGASVGRCCLTPNDVLPARVNQHVSIIRPNKILNPIYLCYLMISQSYQKKLLILGNTGGATREAITKKQIENLDIPVPTLEHQAQFADFVQQVETQKSLLQQSLAKLKLNYKSLTQKCFNGEVF